MPSGYAFSHVKWSTAHVVRTSTGRPRACNRSANSRTTVSAPPSTSVPYLGQTKAREPGTGQLIDPPLAPRCALRSRSSLAFHAEQVRVPLDEVPTVLGPPKQLGRLDPAHVLALLADLEQDETLLAQIHKDLSRIGSRL